jgi:hypothetical protein
MLASRKIWPTIVNQHYARWPADFEPDLEDWPEEALPDRCVTEFEGHECRADVDPVERIEAAPDPARPVIEPAIVAEGNKEAIAAELAAAAKATLDGKPDVALVRLKRAGMAGQGAKRDYCPAHARMGKIQSIRKENRSRSRSI